MRIPQNEKELTEFAVKLGADCRVSQARRVSAYKQYGQWIEAGRATGGLALANMLYSHLDRLASHLFSPSELRFAIDYKYRYTKQDLEKGAVAAREVSREWERTNVDMLFGHGSKEALGYGTCILKQLAGQDGQKNFLYRGARLVMPWDFGVYNEKVNELGDQEAFGETVWMTKHEVWRRVRNLPDAEKLYKRALGNAKKEEGSGTPNSFMHQVLSTATLNTTGIPSTPQPGGIVQLSNDPNYAMFGPDVAAELYPMHELWVRDDNRDDDYTTIQLIEPDILVAPRLKHANLFSEDCQPYTLIQPNFVPGYFWGRSEVVDLMMLQSWLSEHLDDTKRLMGQQIDKLLAFPGYEGLNDELYAQFRSQGYMGLPPGADVKDLTPQMPPALLPLITEIIQLMNIVSGFPPIMSGQGEPGVRSDVHAGTLIKTGSPRLRDRSLLLERQCANAADITLSLLQAKEAKAVWTSAENEQSDFVLSQLPDDRRISVDAHSSSPIYADDHAQLLAWGLKSGIVTGESAIEQMPFAHKDILIARLREAEAAKAKFIQEHPEVLSGGRSRQNAGHLRAVGENASS